MFVKNIIKIRNFNQFFSSYSQLTVSCLLTPQRRKSLFIHSKFLSWSSILTPLLPATVSTASSTSAASATSVSVPIIAVVVPRVGEEA